MADDLAWSKEAAEGDAKRSRAKQAELEAEVEELKTTILDMEGEAGDLRDTVSTLQGDLRAMEARFDAKVVEGQELQRKRDEFEQGCKVRPGRCCSPRHRHAL